jgi:hypothetical protein
MTTMMMMMMVMIMMMMMFYSCFLVSSGYGAMAEVSTIVSEVERKISQLKANKV